MLFETLAVDLSRMYILHTLCSDSTAFVSGLLRVSDSSQLPFLAVLSHGVLADEIVFDVTDDRIEDRVLPIYVWHRSFIHTQATMK